MSKSNIVVSKKGLVSLESELDNQLNKEIMQVVTTNPHINMAELHVNISNILKEAIENTRNHEAKAILKSRLVPSVLDERIRRLILDFLKGNGVLREVGDCFVDLTEGQFLLDLDEIPHGDALKSRVGDLLRKTVESLSVSDGMLTVLYSKAIQQVVVDAMIEPMCLAYEETILLNKLGELEHKQNIIEAVNNNQAEKAPKKPWNVQETPNDNKQQDMKMINTSIPYEVLRDPQLYADMQETPLKKVTPGAFGKELDALESAIENMEKSLTKLESKKSKENTPVQPGKSTMEGMQLRQVSGKTIASPVNDVGVVTQLDPMIYTLSMDDKGNIYFEHMSKEYKLPKLILGETNRYLEQIMTSVYDAEQGSVGIIMTGLAGSGKSLLAEALANRCINTCGMPVLVVDKKLPNTFLKDCMRLAGPCVVYFDELGKYYDTEAQGKLLTLFSDSEFENNLYIVCDNEKHTLHRFFFDRPGRFLYHVEYHGLSNELVLDFLDTHKVDGVFRDYILEYVKHYKNKITFDILRTLVKFAKKAKDTNALKDIIMLLNVPNPPITTHQIVSILKGEDKINSLEYSLDYNKLSGEFKLMLYKDKVTQVFKLTDECFTKSEQSNGDIHYSGKVGDVDIVVRAYLTAPNEWMVRNETESIGTKVDPYETNDNNKRDGRGRRYSYADGF